MIFVLPFQLKTLKDVEWRYVFSEVSNLAVATVGVIEAFTSFFLFFYEFCELLFDLWKQNFPFLQTVVLCLTLLWPTSFFSLFNFFCWFKEKFIANRALLAFAELAAHSWLIEMLSVARTGQDKLTLISVAVTDQVIGLFISALCVVYVTMHWLAKSPPWTLWQICWSSTRMSGLALCKFHPPCPLAVGVLIESPTSQGMRG